MRRLLLAAAGVLMVVAAAPAVAGDTSRFVGECDFDAVATGGSDVYNGAARGAIVAVSATHGNLVAAEATCEVRVNDVTVAAVSGRGVGLVPVAGTVSFVAGDVDVVRFCTVVDFLSDTTPTQTRCQGPTQTQFPPQEWIDLMVYVLDGVTHVLTHLDPVTCAGLALLAPGVGPLVVDDDGDVSDEYGPLYECPPYEGWEPPPWSPPGSDVRGTGAGWNDGTFGSLTVRTPDEAAEQVVATCAYAAAPGGVRVTGRASAAGADATAVRCRLVDETTGTVVYDDTASAAGATVAIEDAIAGSGGLTLCTEGRGTWGTAECTTGLACRYAVTP